VEMGADMIKMDLYRRGDRKREGRGFTG